LVWEKHVVMTLTTTGPPEEAATGPPRVAVTEPPRETGGGRPPRPVTPGWIAGAAAAWVAVSAVVVVLVLYGVGPLLEQRAQSALIGDYRADIRQASFQSEGLAGIELPTRAPETGAPVAIVDIPDLQIEQVVVEGVGPRQTRRGPGHVPGTAGPGQPGNSAVVARRTAYGGAFRQLGRLERGDRILVTTTQGQSVYEVTDLRSAPVATDSGQAPAPTTTTTAAPITTTTGAADPAASGAPAPTTTTTTPRPRATLPDRDLTTADLYGPSPDDRLTLVTAASSRPWSTELATVVVATMRSQPFAPTPQNGRTAADDGRSADGGAGAPLTLAVFAYLAAVGAAVVLYRRARPRSAYLMTAPPLVAATMLAAEAAARLLPAWV
jgi:sortase A